MEHQGQVWHTEVMTPAEEEVLRTLGTLEALKSFYLAGGTALALRLGHRRSLDLDFFNREGFSEDRLLGQLRALRDLSVISKESETLHLHLCGVKVSLLSYQYPMLYPLSSLSDVAIADPRDIGCMKISAIASRGTKRDFVDLYQLAQHERLEHLLTLFENKFADVRYNMVHILKSLTYFKDADREPMPDVLMPLSWDQVKEFFTKEVPRISRL